jgi:hypothetical protein
LFFSRIQHEIIARKLRKPQASSFVESIGEPLGEPFPERFPERFVD